MHKEEKEDYDIGYRTTNKFDPDKGNMSYFTAFMITSVLILSTLGVTAFIGSNPDMTSQLVIIDTHSMDDLTYLMSMDIDVIDSYGNFMLVEANVDTVKTLQNYNLRINLLPNRTRISVKGHVFDVMESEPTLCSELSIEGYQEGTKGIYLVHMLGPINPRWREQMDEIGVDILNYVPNYAFEVRMTPEQARAVEEQFFVDWVGIYQPAYKLQEGLEPGMIDIRLSPGTELGSAIRLQTKGMAVDRIIDLGGAGSRVIAVVRDMDAIYEIARDPDVYYISPYSEPGLASEIESQLIGGGIWFMDDQDGDPATAYRLHGDIGAYINQIGYTGQNVIVNIADTGLGDGTLGNAGHPDFTGRVIGGYSYHSSGNWHDGGLGHGTHCAGSLAGDSYRGSGVQFAGSDGEFYAAQGLAYDSELFILKIFTGGGAWIGPDEIWPILEIPKQMGDAYVQSNSWGDWGNPGHYIFDDEVFDQGVRDADRNTTGNQPMVVVAAAGNEGRYGDSNTISPGTAKNTITIGGTHTHSPDGRDYGQDRVSVNPHNIGDFSSKGWTADNRIKPDVVAPGQGILSTKCPLAIVSSFDYTLDGRYTWMSGTSMATPAAAGAAAVVVEWYEVNYGVKPNPAMVKALMINTANDLPGSTGSIPNIYEGWGMVDISKLEYPYEDPVPLYLMDQASLLTTGDTDEYQLEVDREGEPVKISLVWTDKNAMGGDNPTLKNNLNLEVESPNGLVYRGNAFSNSWTQPGMDTMEVFDRNGDGWDDTNNVQNVYIHEDNVEMGTYTVRVIGQDVPEDANNDGVPNQDYALVGYNLNIIGEPPTVSVEYPEDGDIFDQGEMIDILWTAVGVDDDVSFVDICYSQDGGVTWTNIDTRQENTGVYTWEVYNENSDNCIVRIRAHDVVGRIGEGYSGTFEIIGVPPGPPQALNIVHYELVEPVVNGDFVDGYEPWELERVDTGGESRWDDEDYYHTGGSIHVKAEQIGTSGTFSEDSYWQQEFEPIDAEVLVGGAYRRNIFIDDFVYDKVDHAVVEILVRDTEDGWQTVLINEDRDEGDTRWVDFGHVSYTPTGSVDAIRVRMHAQARGWVSGKHALVELWMDRINLSSVIEEGGAHNQITWDASPDDPDQVSHYNVYRSENEEGPWDTEPIGFTWATGSSDYRYVDEYKGTADGVRWWYVVRAVGNNGLEESNTISSPEPDMDIHQMQIQLYNIGGADGWNFVSFNLLPTSTSLYEILEDISGSYERVMYYDGSTGEWMSFIPGRADRYNNLDSWNQEMGVWLKVSEDVTLTIQGILPTRTDITLYPGWNMVGLPSVVAGNHGLPTEVDTIGYFQASASNNIVYDHNPTDFMFEPGKGYWVHNPTDTTLVWEVSYDG